MKNKIITPNLASQIRHDMVTPLTCILGLLGCLSKSGINQEQENYLHDIEDSVASLLGMQNKIDALMHQLEDQH